MEPKRYIFLRRRRVAEARLLGIIVSLILIGLPAELERGVAAEPEYLQGSLPADGAPAKAALRPEPNGVVFQSSKDSAHQGMTGAGVNSPSVSTYRDDVLRAFAVSAFRMVAIRDRWRPVLERAAAAGPEEAAKVQRAQGFELARALRSQGISAEQYKSIFNAAQRDPLFKSYLLSLVRSVDPRSLSD